MSHRRANRRGFTIIAAVAALLTAVTSCSSNGGKPDTGQAGTSPAPAPNPEAGTGGNSPATTAGGSVTIGVMADLTGVSSLFGPPTRDVAQLAVGQINAAGGVAGKRVKLVFLDSASSVSTTKQDAQRLIQQDHVAAMFGMFSSAQREAAEPVAQAANVPFFYTPIWEGGVCKANLFTNGEVPPQQLAPSIPWAQHQTGKKTWYLLGDDYVWPHTSFALAKKYIEAAGGKVVGTDYVPLGTTNFAGAINKVRASGADIMIPALVGADAVAFEKQAYDAGLGNAQVQRLAILYEDNTRAAMGAKVADGMYFSTSYDKTIDTPENKAFLAAYAKKFGKSAPVQTTMSSHTYVAIKSWAKAVDKAGSTSLSPMASALSGMSVDAPAGTVTWGANHFATQPIHVVQVQKDGTAKVVKSFGQIKPDQGCSS